MSTADQPSRRDFLQGRAAAAALVDVLIGRGDRTEDASSVKPDWVAGAESSAGAHVTRVLRRAMACEFEVQFAARCHDGAMSHALEALDLVEALEDQMTVYRGDSEVIRLNRRAAEVPISVELRLFELFQLAERLYRETDGAFDITSGPLSDAWGFSRRQGRLPSEAEIAAALERIGMDRVVLDAAGQTVAYRRPDVTLHLNCIGKGHALDRMAELLDANGMGDYLLHGGRSSVLARGDCPGSSRPGWTIGLPHPLRPGARLAEFDLVNQALGTSGSGTQFFEHGGRRFGHLLDPRTGWPVEGIYSATVIAPTAAEADALSTAFYVMGRKAVGEYCAKRPELSAVLVCPAEGAGEVCVTAFGVDGSRMRLTLD